jgi:hypothetical protein
MSRDAEPFAGRASQRRLLFVSAAHHPSEACGECFACRVCFDEHLGLVGPYEFSGAGLRRPASTRPRPTQLPMH